MDGRLSGLQRQHESEHGPNSAWILAAEITPVCLGIAARNRQAETGSAGIVCPTMIEAYETLEDPFALRGRYAGTGVPDFGNRGVILFAYHDMHLPMRPGSPHGVVDHVAQDAADLRGIGMGDDLRTAHSHGSFGMKQPYPLDFAMCQGPQ